MSERKKFMSAICIVRGVCGYQDDFARASILVTRFPKLTNDQLYNLNRYIRTSNDVVDAAGSSFSRFADTLSHLLTIGKVSSEELDYCLVNPEDWQATQIVTERVADALASAST